MTVAELEQRLTVDELFEWAEWFQIKHEMEQKQMKKAQASVRIPKRMR